ncbi:MAG: hypothetical protein WKG01_21965 [Kofleriaceae bacterium]
MKTAWIACFALGIATELASAGTLAGALARHGDADVTALRAQRTEVAARCTLGAVYAKRHDLSRAAYYLTDCSAAELPLDIGIEIRKIDRELKKQLRDSKLSTLEVITRPPGLEVAISGLPGETFVAPATIWIKAGKYKLEAIVDGVRVVAASVEVGERARVPAILELPVKAAPSRQQRVDFAQDNAAEASQSGPPPAVQHKTLLPPKYQGVAEADTTQLLEDPLAVRSGPARRPRAIWLGVRLGGGMFDDPAVGARAGMTVGAVARLAIAGPMFVAARLDWSRRGGESPDAIDSLAASAGAGATVLDRERLAVALYGQLRADLRLADTRMMAPVGRAGIGLAGGVELALPATPFTVGVRIEQGLSTLTPGVRDRAIVLELGADWR